MSSRSSSGLPAQPASVGSAASGNGFSESAVQFIAFDPAGGDNERAWRIKDLRDFSAPGGSSVRGPFTIAFNTPSLTDGVAFYTPKVGDILIDAWVDIETAWDGTTPKLDIGSFSGVTTGLWHEAGLAVEASFAARTAAGDGIRTLGGSGNVIPTLLGFDFLPVYANGKATVPAVFTGTNPLKVVVSQTGASGGADPGSAQGLAHIYLRVATPVAF